MEERDAVALAAELAGAYPGRGISAVTVSEWTREFVAVDQAVAVLAVGDVVQSFPDRAPTLGQVREAIRIRAPHPELPPHEDLGYSRQIISGKDADHWQHGRYHLAELLAVPADERTEAMRHLAQHPETCSCEHRAGSGDPSEMVRELAGETT